ncbi:LIM and calponin homology domains-containing protein 1-like isoform X2 [Pecten maximus]|uniref:LIM and calponin homology domains-containing protein 1-like isoform X2 n=1 Tax=Pecten maximus TaxID=6579 RepID=UPI001458236C|nr:LIM and calponin homology domains-containing protein 1-like isoform X2 [Pecten maximus]
MASEDQNEDDVWDLRLRQEEEDDFFTELALHETERWISAVTRKKFQYPDDFRKSLENGVLLCEVLNTIKPGCIRRINKLPGPIAGLDNINVYLQTCRNSFHLKEAHLFDCTDLEDLSQRAISDSEHILKQESDRRARNVAIGIYWLGKSVYSTFSGPQLDFSAFTPLVHHNGKDIISEEHFQHDSCVFEDQSSSYGSHGGVGQSIENKHIRDSAYDSYGSLSNSRESELSFSLEETNMPGVQMRRADSTSSINRSGEFSLARHFDDDSLYQSTPDLSNRNSHTRTSSTDSMDGHSRHSSESTNVSIPTRSQERKTSTANANPLQFVKVNSSDNLAKVATMQIKISEEVKKVRTKIDSDEQEWQSPWASDQAEDWKANFSDWRNKRRRKSEAQLQRVEETDKNVKEEEEKKQVKSYGQMVEERERRKSTGTFLKKPMSFYPVDDDDDLFTPVKTPTSAAPVEEVLEKKSSQKVEASVRGRTKAPPLSQKNRSGSLGSDETYINYDDTKRASWAASESSDEESNKKDNSVELDRLKNTSENTQKVKSNVRSNVLDNNDNSWRKDPSPQRKSGLTGAGTPTKSTGKLTNLLKSFEQKEEEAKGKRFSEVHKDYNRSGLSRSFDLPSSSFSFSAKDKAEKTPVRSTITDKTVPVPTKASVEKTIKISQKPNNKKGFGFTLSGGVDKREPITVQKVSLGSAADVCEVQQNDKILAINKRDISALAQAQVQRLIEEAVRHGQIELKVKRSISDGDDEDDEDDDDDAFVATSPTSPVPKLASALSPRTRGSSGSSASSTGYNSTSKSSSGYVSPSSGDRYRPGTRTENRYGSMSPIRSQTTRNPSPGAIKTDSYRRSASPVENRNTNSSVAGHRSSSPSMNQHKSSLQRENSPLGSRNTPSSASLNRRDPSPVTTRKAYLQEDRTGSPLQRSSPLFKSPSDDSPSRPLDSKIFPTFAELAQLEEETNNNEVKVDNYKTELIKPPSPVGNDSGIDETIKPVKKEMDFSRPPVQRDVKAPETETSPKEEVTISTRQTITVKKKEPPEVKSSYKWEPPASPPVSASPPPAVEEDDGGGGPPAILRRWQQRKPRPQSAYSAYPAFEPPKEEKRLSGSFSWESSIIDSDKKGDSDIEPQVIKLDHQENNTVPPPKTQVGQPVTLEIPDHETPATKPSVVSSYNSGLLQIDPRNQVTENDVNLPEYSFHVNINKPEPRTLASPVTIERERELIRQEEQKILEAQKKQWEEEETRRIKEKEEELQRQAEILQREKEKLKEEQQRMQKEREELERSRKNQIEAKENKPETRVYQPHQNSNPKSQFATSVNTDSKQSLRKLDLTWPPQKEEPAPRQKLTREDMLAMNRRATPLQRKPEIEVNSTEPSKTKDFTSRDAPTKNDLHNLTAVPKQKYRASSNWMKEDQQPQKTFSKSRSDNNRSSPNLHEHWLVEEAERRRKATAHQNSHSAAIQPVSDGIVNRWRDDSFLPKQQASINAQGNNLTQPRSLSSNVSQNHGLDNRHYVPASQNTKTLSQTLPQNFNYSSLSPKNRGDPYAPPKPTRNSSSSTTSSISSPSSPLNPSEQFMAVSGKQACSYCDQELGFGAAMVIESLGLYYHVQCFRCCVCHTALGNGSQGADVRVRVNKLHCRNCYSNDEGFVSGLKFSKV